MINLPTLRQLQYLQHLFETKNFGRAAVACNVTQPTLSQAIQEMEVLMGAKVLDRTKRKIVSFTPFGLQVIETARKIMPELEGMMDTARQMQEPLSGIMRLGVIPTIAPYLLPKFLPSLQQHLPKMNFQVTEDMSHHLVSALEEGQLDIALMALPFETKSLQSVALFEENFVCASPQGTFKSKQKLNTNDLDNQKLLLLQDGHCLRDHILSACHKIDKQTQGSNQQSLRATSLHTLVQMVGQGYGVTLLPEMMLKHSLIPKNVEIHNFKNPTPSRQIGLVWREKSYKSTNIHAVIKQLKKIL